MKKLIGCRLTQDPNDYRSNEGRECFIPVESLFFSFNLVNNETSKIENGKSKKDIRKQRRWLKNSLD